MRKTTSTARRAALAGAFALVAVASAAEEKGSEKMKRPPIPKKALIVAFGDSITHMGSVRDAAKRWPVVVEKTLRARGHDVTVVASGVPGQTTDGAVKRIERDVIARRPHVVLIEFGANDFWKRDGKSRLCPPDRFERNLKEMIRLVREKTPARVILVKNHARQYCMKAKAEGRYRYEDEDYGEAIEKVARETGAILLDVFTPFMAQCRRHGELYRDSIHLAAPGSLLYAEVVTAFLDRLLSGKRG